MQNKTKEKYELWLNRYSQEQHEIVLADGRPSKRVKKYGTWLRKNDPISFNVGYNEWARR
jgi:hypothetical protein